MDVDQVLAFRLARSGLDERRSSDLVVAASCPASDFARDVAQLAQSARADEVTRAADDAVATGAGRPGAPRPAVLHALAPDDRRALSAGR